MGLTWAVLTSSVILVSFWREIPNKVADDDLVELHDGYKDKLLKLTYCYLGSFPFTLLFTNLGLRGIWNLGATWLFIDVKSTKKERMDKYVQEEIGADGVVEVACFSGLGKIG